MYEKSKRALEAAKHQQLKRDVEKAKQDLQRARQNYWLYGPRNSYPYSNDELKRQQAQQALNHAERALQRAESDQYSNQRRIESQARDQRLQQDRNSASSSRDSFQRSYPKIEYGR